MMIKKRSACVTSSDLPLSKASCMPKASIRAQKDMDIGQTHKVVKAMRGPHFCHFGKIYHIVRKTENYS